MNTTFVEWPRRAGGRTLRLVIAGATTPEELDALFEDAFLFADGDELRALFEDGGLLVAAPAHEARGTEAIGRAAAALRESGHTYLSHPRRVLQARGTALVIGTGGVQVAHRGADGAWRLAIALLEVTTDDQGRTR